MYELKRNCNFKACQRKNEEHENLQKTVGKEEGEAYAAASNVVHHRHVDEHDCGPKTQNRQDEPKKKGCHVAIITKLNENTLIHTWMYGRVCASLNPSVTLNMPS